MRTNIYHHQKSLDISKDQNIRSDEKIAKNPFLRDQKRKKRTIVNFTPHSSRTATPSSKTPTPIHIKTRNNNLYYRNLLRLFFIFLPFIGVALSLYIIIFKIKNLINRTVFCSDDYVFKKCIPCPIHGFCQNGELTCNSGYKRSGNLCIIDEKQQDEISKLSYKISKYIASKVNEYCNSSILITKKEISDIFGKSHHFSNALSRIENCETESEFMIFHYSNDTYISFNPILTLKCKLIKYSHNHTGTFILLIGIFLILMSTLYYILRHLIIRSKVHKCAEDIISQIKHNKPGEFKYISDYELLETNPLSKYWSDIITEIERNPCVTILNSIRGRMWSVN